MDFLKFFYIKIFKFYKIINNYGKYKFKLYPYKNKKYNHKYEKN